MKSFSSNFLLVLPYLFFLSTGIFGLELKLPDEKDNLLKTQWTTDEGLPQNTVTKIIQTGDGYLWVATLGGLARFDGIKFTIFNSANTPVIKNNRIVDLVEDLNGVLWFTTEDKELIRLKDGVFSAVGSISTDSKLKIDAKNGLWLIQENKLIRYQTEDLTQTFAKNISELPLKYKVAFSEFADVKIWLDVKDGLDSSEINNFDSTPIPLEILENALFVQNISENRLWIVVDNGVGIWENNSFKLLHQINLQQPKEDPPIFSASVSKKDGSLWLNNAQYLYRITEKEIKTYEVPFGAKLAPRHLLTDREGNIWLGTSSNGLIRLREKRVKVFGVIDEKDSWFSNLAVIQANDETIWVGTTNGLIRLQGESSKLFTVKEKLPNNLVGSLAIDKNGVLWIGTATGLTYFKDSKFSKEFLQPPGSDPDYYINALFFDKDNALWIGYRSRGVQILRDGVFTDLTTKDGLVSNNIHYLFQDSRGIIWIGTSEGLSRYQNGVFTNFTVENGLSNNYIRDIYEDSAGSIWIGTYGGGIVRYKNGIFKPITTKDGLFEDIASRILDDGAGNFWVLGNRGIFSVKKDELDKVADGKIKTVECIVFGKVNGMRVSEGNGGNQPAGWRMKDGSLWFPMIEGGVIIKPKPLNQTPPPVYVEQVILPDENLISPSKIEMPPGGGRLEINYTGLSFSRPEQVQFRYKLEGFDQDWQSVGTRRTAFYPNLPPGKYFFSVIAMNSDGIWSNTPATLEVEVKAFFWQTRWLYLLLFLVVLAVIYLIFRIRLQQIESARIRQQTFSKQLIDAQERERQRIAAELHDSIGQDLLIIKNRALIVLSPKSTAVETQEQISEISETASHALDETRAIARNLRPLHLQRFGLTQALRSMLEQIESSSGIAFDTKIDEVDKLFNERDELNVFRIIQECLNNIVKHSATESAKIEIVRTAQIIKILIQDYGQGFEIEKAATEENTAGGFGLTSIKQRVEILGGNIKLETAKGIGTTIIISLNIRNE